MTLRTDFAVRSLRPEDAEAAATLLRELETSLGYRASTSVAEVREWWARADLDVNSWAYERDGDLCGFGWIELRGDAAEFGVQFAPSVWDDELALDLIERSESRIAELGIATARAVAMGREARLRALYEGRGYRRVRTYYLMSIDLDERPPEASLPVGIVVDAFREEDARGFHAVLDEAFADEWGFTSTPFEEWHERRVAGSDTSYYFCARAGAEIVGALRGQAEYRGGGFVAMVGVLRSRRGRGIGEALLRHAFRAWYDAGARRVLLAVDSENATGATRLYERVGMKIELENVLYEKEPT